MPLGIEKQGLKKKINAYTKFRKEFLKKNHAT